MSAFDPKRKSGANLCFIMGQKRTFPGAIVMATPGQHRGRCRPIRQQPARPTDVHRPISVWGPG
jgi:hypothetical protein